MCTSSRQFVHSIYVFKPDKRDKENKKSTFECLKSIRPEFCNCLPDRTKSVLNPLRQLCFVVHYTCRYSGLPINLLFHISSLNCVELKKSCLILQLLYYVTTCNVTGLQCAQNWINYSRHLSIKYSKTFLLTFVANLKQQNWARKRENGEVLRP